MALSPALVDTSVVNRFSRPQVQAALTARIRDGHVALCAPVAFEVRFSARDATDLRQMSAALDTLPEVPIRPGTFDRAFEVQELLAERGQHRSASLVDLLVAAAAEVNDLTVVHYDSDFDLIAAVTGQATEWVVPRGTVA